MDLTPLHSGGGGSTRELAMEWGTVKFQKSIRNLKTCEFKSAGAEDARKLLRQHESNLTEEVWHHPSETPAVDPSAGNDSDSPSYHPSVAFEADCGPKDGVKHLSYRKAELLANEIHPRIREEEGSTVRYYKYPILETPFGSHFGLKSSFLAQFGPGIALYFKWVKFMVVLFGVMSLLVLPTQIYFIAGGADTSNIDVYDISTLKVLTLGNLGEGETICSNQPFGNITQLTCSRGKMLQIQAYYGEPTGSCRCPANRRQSDTGECQAEVDGVCLEGDFCYAGDDPVSEYPCCSHYLNSKGDADFTDLQITPSDTCNSNSATTIARGYCHGKKSCTLPVNLEHSFVWPPSESDETDCDPAYLEEDGGETFCRMKFKYPNSPSMNPHSGLEQCGPPSTHSMFVIAKCYVMEIDVGGTTYKKDNVAYYMAVADMMSSFVLMAAVLYLLRKERKDMVLSDVSVLTVSDYTVVFNKLPKHASLRDLKDKLTQHIERVLMAECRRRRGESSKMHVADIHFGLDAGTLIKLFKIRGDICLMVDRCRKRTQKCERLLDVVVTAKEQTHYTEKLERINAQKEKLLEKFVRTEQKIKAAEQSLQAHAKGKSFESMRAMANLARATDTQAAFRAIVADLSGTQAVAAFVTFEHEEGYEKALECFPDEAFELMLQKKDKKCEGTRLSAKLAPEPSDIIWENLALFWQSLAMKFITGVAALAMLLGSFLIIYTAKSAQNDLEAKYPPVVCPSEVTVEDVLREEYWQYYETQGQSEEDTTGALDCYCTKIASESGFSALYDVVFTNPGDPDDQSRLCWDWWLDYVEVRALALLAIFSVVLVNLVLRGLLRYLTNYELHASKTNAMASMMVKLFIAQVVNTGLLVLIINGNLEFFGVTTSTAVLFQGEYSDFSEAWYETVGVSIILTMFMNIVTPHMMPLLALSRTKFRRWKDRGFSSDHSVSDCVTQRELEELYIGPEFSIAERYATGLNTIFVTLLFSSGMPILYPIACASFFLAYWVDKVAFLRLYRTPPRYTEQMAVIAAKLFPLAIVLHLAFGMWMYSNEDIIPDTDVSSTDAVSSEDSDMNDSSVLDAFSSFGINERLKKPHVIPMLFAFVCCLVASILYYNRMFFMSFLPNRYFARLRTVHTENAPPYYDAVPPQVLDVLLQTSKCEHKRERLQEAISRRKVRGQSRLIEGTPTYSMLDVTEYQQMFAVELVNEVRAMTTDARQTAEEGKAAWKVKANQRRMSRQADGAMPATGDADISLQPLTEEINESSHV